MDKYSRDDLETAIAGAHIIVEQAGEIIRERDARVAELEAAAHDLLRLINQGHQHVENGRIVRDCVLSEEVIAQLRRALGRDANPSDRVPFDSSAAQPHRKRT